MPVSRQAGTPSLNSWWRYLSSTAAAGNDGHTYHLASSGTGSSVDPTTVRDGPIEDLYFHLKECFVIVLSVGPLFTVEQMIDKAVRTPYSQAVLEWDGFVQQDKT